MHSLRWIALSITLGGCGASFDTKPVDVAPASTGRAATTPPTAPCAATEPCAEPFAIAEVAFETDLFEQPPALALPVGAKLEIGQRFGSVGQGPEAKSEALHFASVTYADDIALFERDVAAPMRAAVKAPPQTWLAFVQKEHPMTHARQYQSVVLRQPFLVTSADVARARAAERSKTTIQLGPGGAIDEQKAHAVDVTLSDDAAARIAAWSGKHPEHPLASVVHGRVVEMGRFTARDKQFWVDLPWAGQKESRVAAANLVREIEERAKK